MATSKKNEKRYSGIDSVSWIVRDSTGKRFGTEAFPGFKEANEAAKRANENASDGIFHGPARA